MKLLVRAAPSACSTGAGGALSRMTFPCGCWWEASVLLHMAVQEDSLDFYKDCYESEQRHVITQSLKSHLPYPICLKCNTKFSPHPRWGKLH